MMDHHGKHGAHHPKYKHLPGWHGPHAFDLNPAGIFSLLWKIKDWLTLTTSNSKTKINQKQGSF